MCMGVIIKISIKNFEFRCKILQGNFSYLFFQQRYHIMSIRLLFCVLVDKYVKIYVYIPIYD